VGSPGSRVAVVVIDACGVGALPDADRYGDAGANTLAHVAEDVGGLELPTLRRLGLGSILPLAGVPPAREPVLHGRLHPLGPGKDSTAGHWELMGVAVEQAPPTYPDGVPDEVLDRLARASGHEFICNRPYNGVAAIDDYGAEHLQTGKLILYTSQDSVLQLAAHADRLPAEQLYAACAAARETMHGEHAVGRVIARPFTGEPGHFVRTDGRRDYALPPPRRSYLDELSDAGVAVHAVGKVNDLFAGAGIGEAHAAHDNATGLAATTELLRTLPEGFVFTNLIDTDQVHGHRKDAEGFHAALRAVDAEVAVWLDLLREEDVLVLTADHGVDPHSAGTDHTREYVPLLAVLGAGAERPADARHDGPMADVGATALRWLTGRDTDALPGRAFAGRARVTS
jgi:phosphopentomutase